MKNRKKIFVLIGFLAMLFLMMTYAGGTQQNNAIVTRTVTFIDNCLSSLNEIEKKEVELGGSLSEFPIIPTHEGFVFTGWFDEYGVKVSSLNNIVTNIILTAKCEQIIVMNTESSDQLIQVTKEEEYLGFGDTNSKESINNNTFSNEKEDRENDEEESEKEVKSFTVKYLDWDGTLLYEQVVLKGEVSTPPEDPEREGYMFIGWDTDYTLINEDFIVRALYEKLGEIDEDEESIIPEETFDSDVIVVSNLNWNNGNQSGINSFMIDGMTLKNNKNYMELEDFNIATMQEMKKVPALFTVIEKNIENNNGYEKEYVIKVALYKNGIWVLYNGSLIVNNEGGKEKDKTFELTKEI